MKRLLLKYFIGDDSLTEEEIRALEEQIDRDPEWFMTHDPDIEKRESPHWNTELELRKAHERLGIAPSKPARTRADRIPEPRRRGSQVSTRRLHSAIGILSVLILTIVGALWIAGPFADGDSMREYAADRGKRIHLTLDDGTQVILNAESRLRVSTDFGRTNRTVHLQGEAFFDVDYDASRPFLISAGDASVRVLGTAFVVRSYVADPDVRVVVRDGRVSLSSSDRSSPTDIELTAGEAGLLSASGEIVLQRDVDLNRALAWIEGRLVFDDAPLADVARELERWYDITIHFTDDRLRDLPLTTQFEGQSVSHVVDVIARTMDLEYEISQRQVTLSPAKP
jgi:transmembrane sensor